MNAETTEPESTDAETNISEAEKQIDIDDENNMANPFSGGGGARGGSVGGSRGSGSGWRGSSGHSSGGYYGGGSSRSAAGRMELGFGVAVAGVLIALSF